MFLIGAPLGSIIRKGGIGLPLVVCGHLLRDLLPPEQFWPEIRRPGRFKSLAGMWMPTYVLTPVGAVLIYKALNGLQAFNKEFYFRLTRKIRPLLSRSKWTGQKKNISIQRW